MKNEICFKFSDNSLLKQAWETAKRQGYKITGDSKFAPRYVSVNFDKKEVEFAFVAPMGVEINDDVSFGDFSFAVTKDGRIINNCTVWSDGDVGFNGGIISSESFDEVARVRREALSLNEKPNLEENAAPVPPKVEVVKVDKEVVLVADFLDEDGDPIGVGEVSWTSTNCDVVTMRTIGSAYPEKCSLCAVTAKTPGETTIIAKAYCSKIGAELSCSRVVRVVPVMGAKASMTRAK